MGNDTTSQIEYYARAMKAPRIGWRVGLGGSASPRSW
jgi:hypothetical protein